MTGRLRASVTCVRGPGGGTVATSLVGPNTIYAATQEYGREIFAKRTYMHWINDRGPWWKKRVYVPPRPYLGPALRDVVEDGSLVRAAGARFAELTGLQR